MRRNKPKYIDVRIEQLQEEVDNLKSLTTMDKSMEIQWYNRIIQELTWVKQIQEGTTSSECWMETAA